MEPMIVLRRKKIKNQRRSRPKKIKMRVLKMRARTMRNKAALIKIGSRSAAIINILSLAGNIINRTSGIIFKKNARTTNRIAAVCFL